MVFVRPAEVGGASFDNLTNDLLQETETEFVSAEFWIVGCCSSCSLEPGGTSSCGICTAGGTWKRESS